MNELEQPGPRRKIFEAIRTLQKRGEYPSAIKIARILGRKNLTLNGTECKIRTELFKLLNITKMEKRWKND